MQSRRALLQSVAASLLSLGGLGSLGGCGKREFACTGVVGISLDDVKTRQTLAYVDRSTDPEKTCEKCQQFVPVSSDACGTCKVMKGPIHPSGTCKSFSGKG